MEKNCGVLEKDRKDDDDEAVVLPGFRFHPTDEELVGFYLRRKVEGKSISIELIRQVDIYKYDPWDLPKMGSSVGEKEWYFFCKRGRKYRNSIRPNRVTLTGSGFWKATGIDKPIHSSNKCVGLKKSLVYYRGNAGKGTKTDWMMHEFRLPPASHTLTSNNSSISNQEAEVWTLCRIFKRNASYKKCTPNWKHNTINKETNWGDSNSTTCSLESAESNGNHITFKGKEEVKNNLQEIRSHFYNIPEDISILRSPIASSGSNLWTANGDEFFRNGNWDELGSVIGLAVDRAL